MTVKNEFYEYALACQDELKELLCALAVIPAPSNHEEKRAAFVKDWLEKAGAKDVYIDDALNVVWPVNVKEDNDLVVLMAHTDIVFDESVKLEITEKDGKLYCPGVGDDTARLCVLLLTARYLIQKGYTPKYGILFVANSCEEGLGNLKGSRKIVADYGKRIKYFVSFDTGFGCICVRPVGSHRYKVTVRTEGGHSYGAFGNRNAIHIASSIINSLYSVKVPKVGDSKTTYNVGGITGGTSVNTIAQHCEFLYEYRSNDRECLSIMKNMFGKMIEAYNATGAEVSVELLGERPCMGDVDQKTFNELINMAKEAYAAVDVEAKLTSSSTDANTPLANGIAGVTLGSCVSGGSHTTGEWCDLESFKPGMCFSLEFISKFFE